MPTYPVNRMAVTGGAARGYAQGAQQRFGNQLALRQTALAERGQQMQERQAKEQEDRMRHSVNIAARQAAEALQFNYDQLDETKRNNWLNFVGQTMEQKRLETQDQRNAVTERYDTWARQQMSAGVDAREIEKSRNNFLGKIETGYWDWLKGTTVEDIKGRFGMQQEALRGAAGIAQEETKGQYAMAGEEAKFGREVGLGERMYSTVQPGEQFTMGGVTVNRSRPPEAAQEKPRESNERDALAVWYYHQWWLPDEAKKRGVDPKTLSYQLADYTIGQKQLPNQQARQKAPMSWSQAYDYAKQYGLSKNLRGQQLETMARDYANRLTCQQVQEPGTQPAAQPSAGFAMPAGPAGETQATQQPGPPQGWGRNWQEAKAMAWKIAKQKIPDLTPQEFEQNWRQDGPMVVIQDLTEN